MSSKLRAQLLARKRAKDIAKPTRPEPAPLPRPEPKQAEVAKTVSTMLSKSDITVDMLNDQQATAVRLLRLPAQAKDSFVIMGAAGSGKTTTVNIGINEALQAGAARNYATIDKDHYDRSQWDDTDTASAEYFRTCSASSPLIAGAPRIVVLSYTNVAVRNIKEILPPKLKPHCTTFHKILGYQPEEIEVPVTDAYGNDTGEVKTSKPFIPRYGIEPLDKGGRGLGNGEKLPHFDLVIIEEAGTVPIWLYETFYSALPFPELTKFVFLGDIEQLDPAFGDGILGYKFVELPCVHLSETYRNVGIITQFAHRILTGKPISPVEAQTWNREENGDTIELKPFKRSATPDIMNRVMGQMMTTEILEGRYDENSSVLLIPFNKEFGTIELNKWIMQAIAVRDGLQVYEVVTNREHHYFCIGDKVMYNKAYYKVTEIEPNPTYTGTTKPFPPSKFIDRWGRRRLPQPHEEAEYELEREALAGLAQKQAKLASEDIDKLLETYAEEDTQGSNAASHILHLSPWSTDDAEVVGTAVKVKSASDLNSLVLPYALTVHKAQGSEWETVWMVMHQSHAVALKRELFYTGVTRARKHLKLFYSDVTTTMSTSNDSLTKAVVRQAIPGRTLEEKMEHFRKKMNIDDEKARLRALREKYNFGKSATVQEM